MLDLDENWFETPITCIKIDSKHVLLYSVETLTPTRLDPVYALAMKESKAEETSANVTISLKQRVSTRRHLNSKQYNTITSR